MKVESIDIIQLHYPYYVVSVQVLVLLSTITVNSDYNMSFKNIHKIVDVKYANSCIIDFVERLKRMHYHNEVVVLLLRTHLVDK